MHRIASAKPEGVFPGELLRELPSEELLGPGRSAHPQRDRSQVRLEEELEDEEAAALPLDGDEACQSLDPLPTPGEDELVSVLQLPHAFAAAEEIARDLLSRRERCPPSESSQAMGNRFAVRLVSVLMVSTSSR